MKSEPLSYISIKSSPFLNGHHVLLCRESKRKKEKEKKEENIPHESMGKVDIRVSLQPTQENRLGLLSHLGCVIKTPQSLGERLTLTLTGPVTLSNGNWYIFE